MVDYSSLTKSQKLKAIITAFPETKLVNIVGREEVKMFRGLNDGVIPNMLST
jgi:hypothetical protein